VIERVVIATIQSGIEPALSVPLSISCNGTMIQAGSVGAALPAVAGRLPCGQWSATPIDEPGRIALENHYSALERDREKSFYFDLDYTQDDADLALERAEGVVNPILNAVGVPGAS
jgi:hypothetical protein